MSPGTWRPHATGRRRSSHLTTRFEDLAQALRAHASGLWYAQAAVELLIGHQRWLCHDEFVSRFVRFVPTLSGDRTAMVAWRAAVRALGAGRLACSDSEGHVLRVAASLAEGVVVDLRECLPGLDATNAALVAAAVLRAAGRAVTGGELR